MGNLRALVSIAAIAFVAACGDGDAKPDAPIVIIDAPPIDGPPDAYVPDAPNYNFTCLNNSAPSATTTVLLGGTAREVVLAGTTPSVQPAPGVQIDACKGDCQNANRLDRQTTDAQGNFTTAAIPTGGNPVDGYLLATKTGNRTTYVYPASPLAMNQPGVPVFVLSNQVVQALAFAGINQLPANSIVGILVTDCSQPPIPVPGAVVTAKQNGVVVGDPPQDVGALDPQGDGVFIAFNVPPGNTEVSATYMGMTFRAHTVGSVAGTTTMTQIKPGF
jgi:hypothetical protein